MTGKIGKMYYEVLGKSDGPVILFIHGWQSHHVHTLMETLRFYEQDYKCVYIDLLGYGKSDLYDKKSKRNIAVQSAEAIVQVLDELDLKDIYIYGTCTGGNIGSMVCTIAPERVKAFIWLDGYLFFEGATKLLTIPFLRVFIYKTFLQSRWGINIANWFAKFYTKVSEEYIQAQKKQSAKISLDYMKALDKLGDMNFIKVVELVSCPSIYIIGENTVPSVHKSQKYWKEHAQIPFTETISASSHFALVENPDELNNKIKVFIKTVSHNIYPYKVRPNTKESSIEQVVREAV